MSDPQEPAHSVFAPSSSAGWATCAGFLRANMGRPDTAGVDAAYGTVAHSLTEEWLRTGRMPRYRLGRTESAEAGGIVFQFPVDEEMMDYAGDCVAWVEGIPGDRYVETRVDFSDLTPIPKQKGTCDLAICRDGHLAIRDWKFGTGVQVFVCDDEYDSLDDERHKHLNTQLALYAYGALREWDMIYDFHTISIGIGQPRLEHWQVLEISRDELLAFAAWMKDRATAAWQDDAPRTPSPKACRWCKAKDCHAVLALQQSIVDGSFEDLTAPVSPQQMALAQARLHSGEAPSLPKVGRLTNDDIGRLLPYRKLFEDWFSAVEREAEYRAMQGEKIPGYKMVEGRTHRHWRDEKEAEMALRASGVPYRDILMVGLISPAQAEEAMKLRLRISKKEAAKRLAELVVKPPGRQTLVREHDSRPVLESPIEGTFADLTVDDDL